MKQGTKLPDLKNCLLDTPETFVIQSTDKKFLMDLIDFLNNYKMTWHAVSKSLKFGVRDLERPVTQGLPHYTGK